MIARILKFVLIASLIGSAVSVYRLKYESVLQAEKITKLRSEIRREKEAIALLRAEWAQLSRPERIQTLAARYTGLKPFDLSRLERVERINQLPDRPPPPPDLIGDKISEIDDPADGEELTGAIPPPRSRP